MGKYGSGITIDSTCRMEIEEAREILKPYHLHEEDLNTILMMIIEPYFQLSNVCESGRAMERLYSEKTGQSITGEDFKRYIKLCAEEAVKFPFTVTLDDEEVEEDE